MVERDEFEPWDDISKRSVSHQEPSSRRYRWFEFISPPHSSVLAHYNMEIAVDPRVALGFCARCEPEKAITLRSVRIPWVFSLSAEETVRFTAGADSSIAALRSVRCDSS